MESTSETKKLEWAVKHPEWVVKNVTTLFVVAFEDSFMDKPANCYPLTQIGGKPL